MVCAAGSRMSEGPSKAGGSAGPQAHGSKGWRLAYSMRCQASARACHTHVGGGVLVHAFDGDGEDGVGARGVLVHHGCAHGAVLVAHLSGQHSIREEGRGAGPDTWGACCQVCMHAQNVVVHTPRANVCRTAPCTEP